MKAQIDHFEDWIDITDPQKLKEDFEQLLIQSGFGVLNFMEHHFSPQGYTAIWLLAESHCAIHTFPEEDKTYVQLSSCNRQMYLDFIEHLQAYVKQKFSLVV